MNRRALTVLLATSLLLPAALAQSPKPSTTPSIRIGVDIRLGYQQCLDSWTPVANYLSQAIPDHRFVVMPLASYQDTVRVLENGVVEFLVLDPAMEVVARDRFGVIPLLSQVECPQGDGIASTFEGSSSTLIRRADRSDIVSLKDLRGKQLSAVKSWSLAGWLAAWELFQKNGMDPHTALKQVVFEGTSSQVVRNVLAGASDLGVVDTQMLLHMVRSKKLSAEALCMIDREGKAVSLNVDKDVASTEVFPGRLLSKAKDTSSDLAQRVVDALRNHPVSVVVEGVSYERRWGLPSNYSRVRQLLQVLVGPDFAESPGYPLSRSQPKWLVLTLIHGSVVSLFLVSFLLLRRRHTRRQRQLEDELAELRSELLEARAETQRINTVLTLAGCGIDIVDENNRIIFADANLERIYGDWRGHNCHEYYCKSVEPCAACQRPSPASPPRRVEVNLDDSTILGLVDPHAKVHYTNGHASRMIGIPFSDEGGRWLYARLHIPDESVAGSPSAL